MQVIDIPSSPEPLSSSGMRRTRSASRQPGPPRKRPRPPPPAREPSIVEIIELTDSDSDTPARQSPTKNHPSGNPHPQPTKTLVAAPAVSEGLPDASASAPESLQRVARQERQEDGVPLFLLGSDDEQHAVHPPLVPVARDVPDAVPLALPQPAPPEPSAPQVSIPVDPVDAYIARVLEIVPDVQPAHALVLIEQFMQAQPGNVVEFVLHALFENPSYPKVDKKGKHKRDEADDNSNARGSPKPKVDYASKERVYNCGPFYLDRSLEQLMADFPRIPKPHIRTRLLYNRFYAPTYLLLAEELKKDPLPFKLKSTVSVVGKGKARQDPEFDKEREWVLLKAAELATEQDATLAASVNEQECEENGEGIECGCCFSGYPFGLMIQCPEAHLFCKSCMTSYASNLLGEHNPNIVCMDQSGCKLPFPESELARFLSPKLLELYYRVKQRKEIEAAGLENLEECPFCEYKCVIENATEKLFRCENTECGAVTCRECKKSDHLPMTCKEAEQDKHLDVQHVIEEAMTQALMRNCPKCQKSFIKEMGCNKMTCPNCHTVSCYICRKIINGYDHFSNPPPYSGKVNKSKCSLWDAVEQRHAEEVSEAAKRALTELRKSRPDVDESTLKVDIPVVRGPPHTTAAPHQAALRLNGVAGLPPYNEAGAMRMGGPGGGEVNAPWGDGMGGPLGAGVGLNPFVFGAGQGRQFLPPGFGVPNRPWLNPPPLAPVVPGPDIPLALARGRRAPRGRAPVQAQPKLVMAAGGRGRRRKGR